MGKDLVVAIGGGTAPHVGSVVVAQPVAAGSGEKDRSPSVSLITIPPHKEEPIARTVAERLSRELGCVVAATAGVHEDGIDRSGIETYIELGGVLADRLLEILSSQG